MSERYEAQCNELQRKVSALSQLLEVWLWLEDRRLVPLLNQMLVLMHAKEQGVS